MNRPKFATNGYWLWLGNVQLHLIQSDLTVLPDHPDGGTRVNHISFDCYDFVECENRIKEAGIEYKKVYVPEGDRGINQIFFQDPDGHWIELCDCHKMNDFIFGEFDEKRCLEMSKFYNEGVELKQEFIATVLLMLLAEHDKENKNNQNSRLKELFNVFSGGDGHICIDDLSYMITRLGGKGGEESIKKLLVGIDKSGEGLISFDEFIDFLVAEVLDAPDEETIKEIFGIIDSNASGNIQLK